MCRIVCVTHSFLVQEINQICFLFVDEGIDNKIRQNTAPMGVAVSVHFSYDPIHLTTLTHTHTDTHTI